MKHVVWAIVLSVVVACHNDDATMAGEGPTGQIVEYSEVLELKKDKAGYNPGEEVQFSVSRVPANTVVRYKSLGKTIAEEPLTSTIWSWTPPATDFRGYMVELVDRSSEGEAVLGTVAVDVSSDWTKFPRYGFLSSFGKIDEVGRNAILDNLKDFHINGIQYYDWQGKHHVPLPLDEGGTPMDQWVDLFNREVEYQTVKGYIDGGHQRNMASMFYNLLYGAWKPEEGDGFREEWLLYTDRLHGNVSNHDLGDFGKILLTDPGNREWQEYISERTKEVYEHLDFDGWHIDQLGDRGAVYDYGGYQVDLPRDFLDFMDGLTEKFPEKKHVFNAVEQFGQEQILSSEVDFAYTEVWDRIQYADLAQVIIENGDLSSNGMNTVLAAYMNYGATEGNFNTPSVLLADAVIFAFGGAHLELGEHMLSSEYFPEDRLSMDAELSSSLKEYYDFMVAYQNLLRDGGSSYLPSVSSEGMDMGNWPPVHGQVAVLGKQTENAQIVQLLNFDGVSTLNWRDGDRIQTEPKVFSQFKLTINTTAQVENVWFASPDFNGGASQALSFEQSQGKITVTVPYLHYWSMIVLE